MDHLRGAGELACNCLQRLFTYSLVNFSEWIYRFSKRLKQLRSLHLSSMEFHRDIKKAYFKILQEFNFGLALLQAAVWLFFRNVQ